MLENELASAMITPQWGGKIWDFRLKPTAHRQKDVRRLRQPWSCRRRGLFARPVPCSARWDVPRALGDGTYHAVLIGVCPCGIVDPLLPRVLLQAPLLFTNPIHQSVNSGVLKAYTAGGIEWNWSPGFV